MTKNPMLFAESSSGQRIPNGILEDNYPRNMWWVAARKDEITETPHSRWLLELPIVLYRTEDGAPVRWMTVAPIAGHRFLKGEWRVNRLSALTMA